MDSHRVVIAGGSGFIGQALTRHLIALGYEPVILTRKPEAGSVRQVFWDGKTVGKWAEELEAAEAVVNLAGRNVSCRYTKANKKEMDESRVDSVRAIDRAIESCERRPRVWVQASSLAIYGDAGERICDETAPPGSGYPVQTCLKWENAYNMAGAPVRRVVLRMGFVLGRDGGVLGTMAGLARWFMGGSVGSGRQYISWVHIDDLCRMFSCAIQREEMTGVYNATGPTPVTNGEFMRTLRRVMRRPWSPPTPALMVYAGAWVLGTEGMLALMGRRCVPKRLGEMGFGFGFTGLEEALGEIYPDNANVQRPTLNIEH